MAEQLDPYDLEGATLLIGITHLNADDSYEQEQFTGIARTEDQGNYCLVVVDCSDGIERRYPFDAHTLEYAKPGEYRLKSTGEVVTDPDFLMTWTVTKEH